jgi:hypothetical protein
MKQLEIVTWRTDQAKACQMKYVHVGGGGSRLGLFYISKGTRPEKAVACNEGNP